MRFIVTMGLVVLVHGASGAAWADEPKPQDPVTQSVLNEIMTTAPQGGTQTTALPIGNLSEEKAAALQQAGGARVIKGKQWKEETAEQREQHLANLKENAAPGTIFLIEVPSGNVWAFQAGEQNATLNQVIRDQVVDPYYPWEILQLPVSVAGWDRPDRGPREPVSLGRVNFKF